MGNYFEILVEEDKTLLLYADKFWVKNNRVYIRIAFPSRDSEESRMEKVYGFKNEGDNIYSISREDFDYIFGTGSFFISLKEIVWGKPSRFYDTENEPWK